MTTDHTDEPHNHPNPPTTHNPHKSATTETAGAAGSTAAGPEPTAPRGRLRRGRPQRTRPCLHLLPERLPRLLEGGRRNLECARGRRFLLSTDDGVA
jgi:hypothetical protein